MGDIMKKYSIVIILCILLVGCKSTEPSEDTLNTLVAQAIAQTGTPNPTDIAPVEPTNSPTLISTTPAIKPTNTNAPTQTMVEIEPTTTPLPIDAPSPEISPELSPTSTIPAVDTSNAKAKNKIVSQDNSGVIVEVYRIVIADKSAVAQDFMSSHQFDDSITLVEIIFRVINNTDKIITLYADQASISINGEQIETAKFKYCCSIM